MPRITPQTEARQEMRRMRGTCRSLERAEPASPPVEWEIHYTDPLGRESGQSEARLGLRYSDLGLANITTTEETETGRFLISAREH